MTIPTSGPVPATNPIPGPRPPTASPTVGRWLGLRLAQLAGGRPDILRHLPGQLPRHVAMGAVLLTTAGFATISAAYALKMTNVASSWAVAIVFGIVWGLAILNLDRMLVIGIAKERHVGRLLGLAAPRVLLALVIGVVISTPLMLKVFEPEIQAQLAVNQNEQADQLDNQLANLESRLKKSRDEQSSLRARINAGPSADPADNAEIQQAQSEIDQLQSKADKQKADYDRLQSAATAESDGTGGTGVVGCGEQCRQKQRLADDARARWEQTTSEIATKTSSKQQRIEAIRPQLIEESRKAIKDAERDLPTVNAKVESLESQLSNAKSRNQEANDGNTGLIARLQALDEVTAQGGQAALAKWAVSLLFLSIELLPVLFKVLLNLSAPTPYDVAVEEIETIETGTLTADFKRDEIEREAQAKHDRKLAKIQWAAVYSATKEQARLREENLTIVNQEVAAHQREVISEALDAWRQVAKATAQRRIHEWQQTQGAHPGGINGVSPAYAFPPPHGAPPGMGAQPTGAYAPTAPTVTLNPNNSLPDPTTI